MTFTTLLPPPSTSLSSLATGARPKRREGGGWGKNRLCCQGDRTVVQRGPLSRPIRKGGPKGAQRGGLHLPEASWAALCFPARPPLDHSNLEGYVFAGSARPSRAREMLPAPPLTGWGRAALAGWQASRGAGRLPEGVHCRSVLRLNVGSRGWREATAARPEMAPSEQVPSVWLRGYRGRARYPAAHAWAPALLSMRRDGGGCGTGGGRAAAFPAWAALGLAPSSHLSGRCRRGAQGQLCEEERLEVTKGSSFPIKSLSEVCCRVWMCTLRSFTSCRSSVGLIFPFVSMIFLRHNPLFIISEVISVIYILAQPQYVVVPRVQVVDPASGPLLA